MLDNPTGSATDAARWAQLRARDPAADGQFWCVVLTTRTYCRPSCPVRPKRWNVTFHDTLASAQATGARPCMRCNPLGPQSRLAFSEGSFDAR